MFSFSCFRTAMEVFLVVDENLAVHGHLVRCGIHFTSSPHQHRALHLHFQPADVSQHRDHKENARRHLRSVALRAYHDDRQNRTLGKVIKDLPVGRVLALFRYACVGHELCVYNDLQSFSHAGQENGAQDWRENQEVLSA